MEIQRVLGEEEMEVETETEVEEEDLDPFAWWAFKPGSRREEWASYRETDGGRKGGGKTVPTLKASCTSTMAPFTVGTRARKTGAEKVREKLLGVWSFCGAFLFEKRYKSKQLFHVEAVATAKDFANNFHD